MRGPLLVLALGMTLSLPMESQDGSCQLDQAQVTAVPPDTFQVMTSHLCGDIRCWERFAQIGEKRIALGRTCETSSERRELAPKGDP